MNAVNWIISADFAILDGVQSALRSGALDFLMVCLTFLGDYGWFWIAAAAFFLIPRGTRDMGRAMALAIAAEIIICNLIMKPAFHRIRPCDINAAVTLLVARPTDFSFPSGHAAVSFAAAASIFAFRKRPGAAALILAVLISFSRIYLYVHYPSDVLAGAAVGTVCALGAELAVKRFAGNKKRLSGGG
ncbi:MAG: phosphatase PAP2 family protein [Firmicutes bacterium]|nr:phosphatase PAP2 family protein [Bacillota bacterium]